MNSQITAIRVALLLVPLCLLVTSHATSGAPGAEHPSTGAADSARRTSKPERRKQLAQSADCISEQWFIPTPREFVSGCQALPTLPQVLADVNHDGRPEAFQCLGGAWTSPFQPQFLLTSQSAFYSGEVPVTATGAPDVLTSCRISVTQDGPKPITVSVLSLEQSFVQPFIDQLPDLGVACDHTWGIFGSVVGWADCDADDDLDLVVLITTKIRYPGPPACDFVMGYEETIASKLIWFENTGFEAALPANPYDLDHDGAVGTSDLSLLLLEFMN